MRFHSLPAAYMGPLLQPLEQMVADPQHILGYFTDQLDSAARQEVIELIEDYRRGLLPLVVPLTLLRHYVRHFASAYLQAQTYLEPHANELMLRNQV